MKKLWMTAMLCSLTLTPSLWAIPSAINYQGTLKQNGLPAGGTQQMLFQITDNGQQVYWSSGKMDVPVINGLFSVRLTPTGVPWDTITPYIQVAVGGQILGPSEPVSATVYAVVASSVVAGGVTTSAIANGAVTAAQLDPATAQSYLVPVGAIMMFDGNCPSVGWSRFSQLDGLFPMGGSTAGALGGQAQHTHTTPNHSHFLAVNDTRAANPGSPVGIRHGSTSSSLEAFNAGGAFAADIMQNVTENSGGGITGSASNIPPYRQMVFCEKM